jgi:hypothetical protein
VRPFDAQKAALLDRRAHGLFDARFHSTSRQAQHRLAGYWAGIFVRAPGVGGVGVFKSEANGPAGQAPTWPACLTLTST